VGHAVASIVADIAELQRIAVDPDHRRTGLATQLLDAVVDEARREDADRLLLEVRDDNESAIAFYAARGFEEIDRRPGYYRDGTTAIVLRIPLREGSESVNP
jgi:ribosomal-protein-alanine N-acetyltransferase